MRKIILLIVSCLFIFGCGTKDNKSYKEIMQEKEYIIVDVRTEEEYLESHIKGAVNIPYYDLDENTNLDKNKNIFVYCASGGRSKIAYETLKKLGFSVYDLGGISSIDLEKE